MSFCGRYFGFILYVTDRSLQHSASSPTKVEWRLLLSAWLPELKESTWSLDSTQDMSPISSQDQGVWRWWCLSVCLSLCLSFSLWPFSSLASICQLSNYLNFLQEKDSYIMTLHVLAIPPALGIVTAGYFLSHYRKNKS